MEIKEEIKLELLNGDSVSVVFVKYIEYAGQKLQVGEVRGVQTEKIGVFLQLYKKHFKLIEFLL